jgi:hypothetical protein
VTVEIEVMYTVTPPVASVVVEAIMVGAADTSDEDAVIELGEVAADPAEVGVVEAVASEMAELATEAEALETSLAAPPESGAGAPPSAPCCPCRFTTGDHAQAVDVCNASTYTDNVDKENIVLIIEHTCGGLLNLQAMSIKAIERKMFM